MSTIINKSTVKVSPLYPHPALFVEHDDRRYIIVSDLHIGLESELDSKGITVHPGITLEMEQEIAFLLTNNNADSLILLGDIKNTVGSISRQEWEDIPSFFKNLSAVADIYLIPGNHDSNITHLVSDNVNIASSKGMVIGDTLFVHGHSMPSEMRSYVNRIVMGHIHPVLLKEGSVVNGERVWISLRAEKNAVFAGDGIIDIVVIPSFNKYLSSFGGAQRPYRRPASNPSSSTTITNSGKHYGRRSSTSPILSRIMDSGAITRCVVVTLDGSVVGDESVLGNVL